MPLAQFLAVGAAVVVLFAVGERLLRSPDPEAPSWEVQRVRGTPRAGGENVAETGRLRAGEALHTDASSEALVKIADIGQLTLDPNTTIRLLVTRPDQHRISLDHGKLEALTWAPPRLFVVETPTAAAVDLGCRYTLEVEKDGGSLLHVTLGVVALQRGDRETVVPAGAFCRTRPKKGPGAPFFEDASEKLRTALDYVDFGSDDEERVRRLRVVIEESRERDALTLWHLLTRLDATSRALLYDRIAEMAPPPSEVTRDGIIALDPHMLDLWKERVAQLW